MTRMRSHLATTSHRLLPLAVFEKKFGYTSAPRGLGAGTPQSENGGWSGSGPEENIINEEEGRRDRYEDEQGSVKPQSSKSQHVEQYGDKHRYDEEPVVRYYGLKTRKRGTRAISHNIPNIDAPPSDRAYEAPSLPIFPAMLQAISARC
ncbi:hypothetical protein PM082_000272 [Marasmius tenuissimus]|nr:hypothetical protein PM082_000272 [Marasmius tenuissimus]